MNITTIGNAIAVKRQVMYDFQSLFRGRCITTIISCLFLYDLWQNLHCECIHVQATIDHMKMNVMSMDICDKRMILIKQTCVM